MKSLIMLWRRIMDFFSGRSRKDRYKKGRSDDIYPLY